MSKAQKLLSELIAIPSVNPALLPDGDPNAGEKNVGDFLAGLAKKAGLDVRMQKVAPNRFNVLASLSPSGKVKQRIILAPHLDTVNAAHSGQFTPRTKNGRIYGRGACDTKGSVAAMFSALCELAQGRARPQSTEIIFAGLVDEESRLAGSRFLAASGLKADLAIVGEPTRLRVVTAHKGNVWLQLETLGKSAHGACPHLGRNAILEMSRIVDALETQYAAQLKQRHHPLLGSPTVNVGTISGGVQPNIVPAHCRITIDRRTIPGESDAFVSREIKSLLKQLHLKASISSTKDVVCAPMETDPALPLVRRFLDVSGQDRPAGVDYFCDASMLSRGGIPSVVFGPGDIAQAHTDDEWISCDSLERGFRMLVKFLESPL
jgi:acetylornithine deacetylase/succinyl-diaminopimelate desuccinylase-like protein